VPQTTAEIIRALRAQQGVTPRQQSQQAVSQPSSPRVRHRTLAEMAADVEQANQITESEDGSQSLAVIDPTVLRMLGTVKRVAGNVHKKLG